MNRTTFETYVETQLAATLNPGDFVILDNLCSHKSEKAMAILSLSCLVPAFDGALFSPEWRDALWVKFYTGAPARRRRSVERYSIVKRA